MYQSYSSITTTYLTSYYMTYFLYITCFYSLLGYYFCYMLLIVLSYGLMTFIYGTACY